MESSSYFINKNDYDDVEDGNMGAQGQAHNEYSVSVCLMVSLQKRLLFWTSISMLLD